MTVTPITPGRYSDPNVTGYSPEDTLVDSRYVVPATPPARARPHFDTAPEFGRNLVKFSPQGSYITPSGSATYEDLVYTLGQVPAFDLDFTRQSVVDRIGDITPTFTRAGSVKLAWNGSQFQSYAADVPAFQLAADGVWEYLHEPPAPNLYLNSAMPATQSIAVTAQQYTLSFYGTGTITLSGASTAGPLVGTGAEPNRVSLTFTPSAGSLTLTLTGSISRPQLETGPIATSPITTSGTSALRAADTLTLSGTNFSRWFVPGGLLYGEFTANLVLPGTIASIDDGTASHRMQLRFAQSSGLKARNRWVSPSSNIDQISINAILGVTSKAALSCGLDRRLASDGVLTDPGTTTTLPTVTQMTIGSAVASDSSPVGIRRLAYFSPGTAQANLLAMTA